MDEPRVFVAGVPDGFITAFFLFLLLAGPRFFARIGLPGLVGLLGAGVLVGPNGLGLTGAHDEVLEFFADLGKLLLLFYTGLEIDLDRFTATKYRSLTFAMLSFAFPLLGGAVVAFLFG
jgi:Kef-type K+ transport system membrane component KefB